MRFVAIVAVVIVACASAPAPESSPVCGARRPANYVPIDLEDSLLQLACTLDSDVVDEMREGSEKNMVLYHHGLGTGLRNGWGLWKGSRLSKYFNEIGLVHPDDMSGVILTSFWRRLHGQPLRVEEQVRYYQAYWDAHSTPPALHCRHVNEDRDWSQSLSEGELPESYVVFYYAECPGEGWFRFSKGDGRWVPIEGEPPGTLSKDPDAGTGAR